MQKNNFLLLKKSKIPKVPSSDNKIEKNRKCSALCYIYSRDCVFHTSTYSSTLSLSLLHEILSQLQIKDCG